MRFRLLMIVVLASVALGGFAAEPERATRPAFKGYELYSWKSSEGAWAYALLPGTNRNKTQAEVFAAGTDLRTLKQHLATLAEHEYVMWVPMPDDSSSLPDTATVADIKRYCATLQLNLQGPPP